MAVATKLIQDFINATKKQLAALTSQLAEITARLAKAEKMISSIQQAIMLPTNPCAGVTITDSLVHLPPTTGSQAYNSMATPALGPPGYQDSVFCKTVRRITNLSDGDEFNYSFHYINAGGTFCFSKSASAGLRIVSTANGAIQYSAQPTGLNSTECRWDMLDSDKYYRFSGASLVRRNLAAQTDTTIKTFSATLQAIGGSANYQSGDGRYFIVKYSDSVKLWDSQTDTIYSGAVADYVVNGGWAGISPSGNTIVTAAGATASPQKEHHAYPINHGAQSIGAFVQYWGLSGDHSVPVSATDGKEYVVTFDSYDAPGAGAGVWRCDTSLDASGLTSAQQRAQALSLCSQMGDGHFSAVSVGSLVDWVFCSDAGYPDDFNQVPTNPPWVAFEQEVFAVNVRTGAFRRFSHHRSRGVPLAYGDAPKVSCNPTGTILVYSSNFNVPGGAQLYVIDNPLTS